MNDEAMRRQVMNPDVDDAVPREIHLSELPPDLAEAILTALDGDPNDRVRRGRPQRKSAD